MGLKETCSEVENTVVRPNIVLPAKTGSLTGGPLPGWAFDAGSATMPIRTQVHGV
jgi:hypothetical protein